MSSPCGDYGPGTDYVPGTILGACDIFMNKIDKDPPQAE